MLSRRELVGLLAAAAARADERTDVLEIIEPLASALSERGTEDFMRVFAEDMPNRRRLRDHIASLIAFSEITSSIELIRLQDSRAELDWYLQIRARATGSVVERRQGTVKIRIRNKKIEELEPVDFFRVPTLR